MALKYQSVEVIQPGDRVTYGDSSGPRTVRELIWHIAASLPKPELRRERLGRDRVFKLNVDSKRLKLPAHSAGRTVAIFTPCLNSQCRLPRSSQHKRRVKPPRSFR